MLYSLYIVFGLIFVVILLRIRRVLVILLLRVVFDVWYSVVVDARRIKEYFEVSNNNIIVYRYVGVVFGVYKFLD